MTELKDEERTRCEIWTRVMGYHRPVNSFNPGKLSEYEERKFYREPQTTEKTDEIDFLAERASRSV